MTLAWLGALAIGVSLGLLGSGGSILTVPVLVYLVGQDEKVAIGGSLFVVGAIATIGGAQYAWRRRVDWRSVLWFGAPGMAGTYLGAAVAEHVPGVVQLALFALVMLTAAVFMLRGGDRHGDEARDLPSKARKSKLALDGLAVGLLAGFVGVGGGFLIVPALTVLGGLPMALAVGTSLVIIALQSIVGFAKHFEVLSRLGLPLDWMVLGALSGVGVVGSVAGRHLAGRIPEERLRRIFGWFLVAVGAWILWRSAPEIL